MNDISPKAEPVAWSIGVGLVLAALASYGLNITPELRDALVMIAPIVIAAGVARFAVYAPDTVEDKTDVAYTNGLDAAARMDPGLKTVRRSGPPPDSE